MNDLGTITCDFCSQESIIRVGEAGDTYYCRDHAASHLDHWFYRSIRAEEEVNRLRGAIVHHREQVTSWNIVNREPAPADVELWAAIEPSEEPR